MAKPSEVVRFLLRSTKRVAVTIVGAAMVLGGIAMFVLPGPGILVVALGFAVLGTEYAWAAVAFERTKKTAAQAGQKAQDVARAAGRGITRRGRKGS